jgi:uncharacterized protein (DUF488 family)
MNAKRVSAMTDTSEAQPVLLTIGHSTRTLEAFIRLLQASGVTRLVDVRRVPRSRRNPQFNSETLTEALNAVGIGYVHLAGLGGLGHPLPDSPNSAWRNALFRGFADYMQTPAFEVNIQMLMEQARQGHMALICAEAVPWRCHRALIADALRVRGVKVGPLGRVGRTPPVCRSALYSLLLPPFGLGSVTRFDPALL